MVKDLQKQFAAVTTEVCEKVSRFVSVSKYNVFVRVFLTFRVSHSNFAECKTLWSQEVYHCEFVNYTVIKFFYSSLSSPKVPKTSKKAAKIGETAAKRRGEGQHEKSRRKKFIRASKYFSMLPCVQNL